MLITFFELYKIFLNILISLIKFSKWEESLIFIIPMDYSIKTSLQKIDEYNLTEKKTMS